MSYTTHRTLFAHLGRLLVALALLLSVLGLAPTGIRAATLDVCPAGCS